MKKSSVLTPGEDGEHITFCRLCEALCGLRVTVEQGTISKIGPDRDHVTSEGHLCVKGARMQDIVHDPDRVLYPLKRTGAPGEFTRVSWEEALADIANRLEPLIDQHGGNSVGAYLGNPASFASMHPAYFNGFLAALGSDKKFNSLHTDTAAKNLAMELVYGNPYRYTFPDLESCDFLIIIGANPAVSHMSLISEPRVLQRLDAIASRGGVVVVDPRLTETASRFEHLAIKPDTDIYLLVMMLKIMFEQQAVNGDKLDKLSVGWRDLRDTVMDFSLPQLSAHCGIAVDAVNHLVKRFIAAPSAACYTRLGTGRGSFPTLTNLLIESLNILAGRLGQAGSWVIGQGAINLSKNNPNPYGSKQSRIGDLPLILGITPGGTLADEITTPGDAQLRALFVDSGNPVLSYPRGDKLELALEKLDLMVSLDLYITETTRYSDYILPATSFLEREDLNELWGANAPRPWIQYTNAVIKPQGESRNEYDIYTALLKQLGKPAPLSALGNEHNPEPTPVMAVDQLLKMANSGDAGQQETVSVDRLKNDFPSGYRLHQSVNAQATLQCIAFDDGRVRLWGELFAKEFARLQLTLAESGQTPFPLKLFGRRRLQSLNSWMHNSDRLTRHYTPALQIHPDDAQIYGLSDQQTARLSSSVNTLEVVVEVTETVVPGSVCYPHGWGHQGGWQRANQTQGRNINLLASDNPADWEQASGICLLDGIPVKIEPV